MDYPAAEFTRARAARNLYKALIGFKHARDVVAWSDANPDAWKIVSQVLELKEAAHG